MKEEVLILSQLTKTKLEKAGVIVVYFFGSRASENYFAFSDYDIGIVIDEKFMAADNLREFYNKVYDILSSEIPDTFDGPKLDVSFLQKVNPILAMKAIREGKILYESSSKLRADFEEEIFKRYDDYRMLQREYEEANFLAFDKTR